MTTTRLPLKSSALRYSEDLSNGPLNKSFGRGFVVRQEMIGLDNSHTMLVMVGIMAPASPIPVANTASITIQTTFGDSNR